MMTESAITSKAPSKYAVCSIACNLKEPEPPVLLYGNIIPVHCLVCVDIFEEAGTLITLFIHNIANETNQLRNTTNIKYHFYQQRNKEKLGICKV